MHADETLIITASAFAVCAICQWLAWRVKLPAIIFLLLAGIAAGPVFHIFNPEQLMGHLFYPFVSLSVAIILFEGSLTLKFRDILDLQTVLRNMLSIGLLITWAITTVTARVATGVSWEIASLFGAITVVTGPTVIAPLLRSVRPTAPVANILRWEGIVIDPIGASFSVLVYEFIISGGGQLAWENTLLIFAKILIIGLCTGIASGYLFGLALRHHWLPDFLQNITSLGFVFGSFVLANTLQPESGLITVTVLGIWLANMRDVDLDAILAFKENLSVLLISLLFIMLASRLEIAAFQEIGWGLVVVFLAVQFLARPLNVMISAIGSQLTFPERNLLSWIAPRGIVAASIASLFAIRLDQAGYKDAHLLAPLTFTIIIGTVLVQSFTARPIARWLKVAEPEPHGFLIIGANIVARKIASAFAKCGVRVLLADNRRDNILRAKNQGLETYLGNPISEHADRHINLTGIGHMLALSPYDSVNIAAAMHYQMVFGKNDIFRLRPTPEKSLSFPSPKKGVLLFNKDITYVHLADALLRDGNIITVTYPQEETSDLAAQQKADHILPLFMIDKNKEVHVITEAEDIKPKSGWTVIALYSRDAKTTTQIKEIA